MSTRAMLVRRLASFGALPLISAITPAVALPILARGSSTDQWAAIAIGQSVGGIGALVISMGWSVVGPAEVARASTMRRKQLLLEAATTRLWAFGITIFPIAILAHSIPGSESHLLATAVAVSATLSGFTIAWYAIGCGRAGIMAWVETVPRILGNVCGAIIAVITDAMLVYPLVLVIFYTLPMAHFYRREANWTIKNMFPSAARLRIQLPAMTTEVIAGVYSIGSPALVAFTGPAAIVATFSTGYRTVVLGSTGIGALSSSLLGWVAEAGGPAYVRRLRVSFVLHSGLGLLGFAVMAVAGPQITGLLFGHTLAADQATCVALGAFFLLWSLETVTGRHVLAVKGKPGTLLATTAVGSFSGIPTIILSARYGAWGAATALAAAMFVIVLLQVVSVVSIVRNEMKSVSHVREQL